MSPRPELGQRKRPKYTRSKTGCLTCRVKKIKCDETKPNCMHRTHGSRDCSWPEGVPARKKSASHRDDRTTRTALTASSPAGSQSNTEPQVLGEYHDNLYRTAGPPKRPEFPEGNS